MPVEEISTKSTASYHFADSRLYNLGVGNIILSCAGLIPGYWVAVATVDTVGRKPIQLMGFIILTILFCIIGFGFHTIPTGGLFALYCLCNFFENFGPNTTTFIVPGEVFPTRYRSTAHGISAGSGKIGAIVAQAMSGALKNMGGTNAWINHLMEIFALFMYIPLAAKILMSGCLAVSPHCSFPRLNARRLKT